MRALCTLFALTSLVACSDGGGSSDAGPDTGNNPDGCACFDGGGLPDGSPTTQTITVLNAGGTSLVSFHAPDTGNVAPFATISGNQTNLSGTVAIAAGPLGVYVVTQLAILVFPPGASGNVAPAVTIAGPSALASTEQFAGIAVGTDGTIYAASELTSGTARNPKINVFAANANGNVAPTRVIGGASSTMSSVLAMAVSPTDVAEADATQNVNFFDPQGTGDIAPKRTLKSGAGLAVGIAIDGAGDLYVADWNFASSSAVRFSAGSQGTAAPVSTITGATTKITAIGGIAVLPDGTTFVANADPTASAVLVFAPAANGDVAPIRSISGAATTLSGDASQGPMPLIVY